MSLLGSSTQLRLGAGLLVISLLPLAVQAPTPSFSRPAAEMHPAEWLEAQVRKSASEAPSDAQSSPQDAFDRALEAAKAAQTRSLHGFLTAFIDAHARLTSAEAIATEGRSCRALVQHLRRQLARTGLGLRPLSQAGAPPVVPPQLVRLMLAAAGPPVERVAPPGSPMSLADRSAQSFPVVLQRMAAPIASGGLLRVLFSGRSLGP